LPWDGADLETLPVHPKPHFRILPEAIGLYVNIRSFRLVCVFDNLPHQEDNCAIIICNAFYFYFAKSWSTTLFLEPGKDVINGIHGRPAAAGHRTGFASVDKTTDVLSHCKAETNIGWP
jgi:hypothetical protein